MDQTEILEGTLFAERYRLETLLGEGGMGRVYLALDTLLKGDKVALKVLHRKFCSQERHVTRFLREIMLTRKITHPNIVRTYEAGCAEGLLFFTMEYAPGETLKDRLARGPLGIEEALSVLKQICRGLTAIHAQQIVHRDLKPGNVILQSDSTAKLTDFGVARPSVSDVTAFHEIVGSIAYMAPEIWRAEVPTFSVDLYAVGVMAFELLAGTLPFDADSPAEMMCHHLEASPPLLTALRPAIPPWLGALVQRLMAKEPRLRPGSASELELLLSSERDKAGAVEEPQPRAPVSRAEEYTRGEPLVSASTPKSEIEKLRVAEEVYASGQKHSGALPSQAQSRTRLIKQRKQIAVKRQLAAADEAFALQRYATRPGPSLGILLAKLGVGGLLTAIIGWAMLTVLNGSALDWLTRMQVSASPWMQMTAAMLVPWAACTTLVVIPPALLAFTRSSAATTARLILARTLTLTSLYLALLMVNILRTWTAAEGSGLSLQWSRLRHHLTPTLQNFWDTALLVPIGIQYAPSRGAELSVMMPASGVSPTAMVVGLALYAAYLYTMLGFISRDLRGTGAASSRRLLWHTVSLTAAATAASLTMSSWGLLTGGYDITLAGLSLNISAHGAICAAFTWTALLAYTLWPLPPSYRSTSKS